MSTPVVRRTPCPKCPYRKDCPSGVWAAEEYDKLRLYDVATGDQPPSAFGCHATPEKLCHGWAVVGSSRGHEHELLALRLAEIVGGGEVVIPPPAVPLWESGTAAADHGERDIAEPSLEAHKAIELLKRYPRLREQ